MLGLFLNAAGVVAAVVGAWLVWQTRPMIGAGFAGELEAEPLRDADPRKIGNFRLLGRVGSGAMGLVYLGHTPTGTFAAVKVMHPELANDPMFRQRFQRELRDIQRVRGRHFPALLDADATAERPWLATKYSPGLALDEVIEAAGPLQPPTVARLAAGVAEALEAIHDNGIVHRDLKPSNVLLDEDGPRVIDFGISHTAQDTKLTRTGTLLGTVAFMAPEQARGDSDIGPATDVFALGSLLVYALTGAPPFGQAPAHAVQHRIVYEEPDLSGLAGAQAVIVELITACLNKDPTQRPSPRQIITVCQPIAGDWLPAELQVRIAHRRTLVSSVDGGEAEPAAESAAANVAEPKGEADASLPRPGTRRPAGGSGRWLRPVRGTSTTRVVVLATVLAVLAAGTLWVILKPETWSSALPVCAEPADVTLRMASSADKSDLLRQMAADYGLRAVDGKCVRVVVDEQNSGKAMDALARGWTDADGPRPDVWSPAASEWLTMARQRASAGSAAVLPERPTASIVTTPLVIAMPEPMAQALGWPNRTDLGWQELAELATDEQGWAGKGKDWGPFRIGKTNPNYSTSGFNATIAAFYASRPDQLDGRRADVLVEGDIDNQQAQRFVQDIEQSIVHYGETTLHFLLNLRRADDGDRALSYISAVTIEESSMLAYNVGYPDGTSSSARVAAPKTKLVAIYPDEGTIYSDHPYIELTWPDTTTAKRNVARDFLTYLHSTPVQDRFQQLGFRGHQGTPGPLVTRDNGANPDATITALPVPPAPVLDKVLAAWTTVRKPANVLLVIDTSDSMNEGVTAKDPASQDCPPEQQHPVTKLCPTKLELIKNARRAIVDGFTDKDRAGLWKFSLALDNGRDYQELVPVGPLGELRRKQLTEQIDGLTTDTDTALYDTIAAAVDTISGNLEANTINAVVVLTDGRDTKTGGLTLADLLTRLQPRPDQEPVRVFTIAFGFGSDEDSNGRSVLQQIAEATGAAKYDAKNPQSITEDLVAAIISNF